MKYISKITILLLMLPIISLFFFTGSVSLSSRQVLLLMRTLLLGIVTGLLSTGISFLLAIKLIQIQVELNKVIYMALIFILPSSMHVMVWYNYLLKMDDALKTVLVLVLYYMPLGTMILWLGLRRLERHYLQVASLYKKSGQFGIVLGLMKPYLLSLFSLIAILVMNDFSVPSLFQYPTYSMELHSYFSMDGQASIMVALPLIAVNTLLLALMLSQMKRISLKSDITAYILRLKEPFNTFIYLPLLIFLIHIVFICMLMGVHFSVDLFEDVLTANGSGLLYSIAISLISGLLATIYAFYLHFNERLKYLLLVYLIIPAPLVGIGIIKNFNGLTIYQGLLDSSFLLILANVLRVLPMLILLVSGLMMTVDDRLLLTGRLYNKGMIRFKKVTFPTIRANFLITLLIGFAFSFNEVASSLLVLPAGKDWISLRIYSYLHYGATDRIFVLVFMVVLIYVMFAMILQAYIKKVKNDH